MKIKVLFLLVITILNATGATIDTEQIDQLTGLKGTLNEKEGAYKISFTREDVTVFVDGWKIPAFMGLSTWAAFTKATHSEAMVMGDTVLLEDEVNLAMFVALESGLSVTALHNHFFFDHPRLLFMHIEGEGTVEHLASSVRLLYDKVGEFRTAQTSSMVMILLAASTFMGAVFSALGTPAFIAQTLISWDIPPAFLILSILVVCFILGWPLEWVPIVVIIVPIFMPMLQIMKVDMVWFSILLAVTLQTCWLSPPVALSAYYLKGIMPQWDLGDIYKGMMPFMALQWIAVLILYFFPQVILVLPNMMFGTR